MFLTLIPGVLEACRRAFPARSLSMRLRRMRMLAAILRSYPVWLPLVGAPVTRAAGLLFEERPETLDAAIRPYLDATWPPPVRLQRIIAHCDALDRLGAPFIFSPRKVVVLADLGDVHPGLDLILDQPAALRHRGSLTLSLFHDGTRMTSVTFSLRYAEDGALSILVGGMREAPFDGRPDLPATPPDRPPHDLLLDGLRALARAIDARRIEAVSDRARVPDAVAAIRRPTGGLDPIWLRHGGIPDGPDRFVLPLTSTDREPSGTSEARIDGERQSVLESLDARIARALATSRPVFPPRR